MEEQITPDPFKNFTPRQNPPVVPVRLAKPITVKLNLSDEELRETVRTKLIVLLNELNGVSLLAVCRELLDRLDGKPMQRQAVMTKMVEEDDVSLTDKEIIRLYALQQKGK